MRPIRSIVSVPGLPRRAQQKLESLMEGQVRKTWPELYRGLHFVSASERVCSLVFRLKHHSSSDIAKNRPGTPFRPCCSPTRRFSIIVCEIRCDLHPRWNREGTQVCMDSVHNGERQMYFVDVGRSAQK